MNSVHKAWRCKEAVGKGVWVYYFSCVILAFWAVINGKAM